MSGSNGFEFIFFAQPWIHSIGHDCRTELALYTAYSRMRYQCQYLHSLEMLAPHYCHAVLRTYDYMAQSGQANGIHLDLSKLLSCYPCHGLFGRINDMVAVNSKGIAHANATCTGHKMGLDESRWHFDHAATRFFFLCFLSRPPTLGTIYYGGGDGNTHFATDHSRRSFFFLLLVPFPRDTFVTSRLTLEKIVREERKKRKKFSQVPRHAYQG